MLEPLPRLADRGFVMVAERAKKLGGAAAHWENAADETDADSRSTAQGWRNFQPTSAQARAAQGGVD
jgi:hypothetical protein